MPLISRRSVLLSSIPIVLTGCGGSKPSEPAKQYPMKGVVLRLDPQVRTAVIKHENIEGWMEAMTMEFPIRDAREFAKLSAGKRITATVNATAEDYWLTNIAEAAPETAAPEPAVPESDRQPAARQP